MDRLNGSARLMIVSDLDCTMVDHDDPGNLSLLRFNALWEAYYRHDSLLVFSTGRSLTSYKRLRRRKPLLTPDIVITSVGTEIAYGESMVTDNFWKECLEHKWDRDMVTEETAKFPELIPQSETAQRPRKVSFFVEPDKAVAVMEVLSERLEKRGLWMCYQKVPAKDRLWHICLKSSKLMERFLLMFLFVVTLEMMQIYSPFLKHMVSNAKEELLQWHEENLKDNPNIIHATERCGAGIIEAIGKFSLGPSLSPRDITDIWKSERENLNPGHEVVNFYLFYERWRRAEVEKSEQYIQNLKSVCHPSAAFVHPSGIERHMHQCIDIMSTFHGDKQGKQYYIWVDRISSAPIGSDTWLLKFDKWEICGEERRCCLATLLVSSMGNSPGRFTWLHMQQTWLDCSIAEDQTTGIF
ncbi:sucrose-phosphatase 1-like isoform X3 [Carica papaya]|uniref:sucrose-phosphatase 1-like isoform X3 n=1 Tax=Carica papaya TaxID=3649 RepID=UPI000B8C9680|nr:sucrose-phosphatase 1-like isoform X3 [Carica papaya]